MHDLLNAKKYGRKVSPFSVNVKNEGYVLPSPSKWYGGGNVADSCTINHE